VQNMRSRILGLLCLDIHRCVKNPKVLNELGYTKGQEERRKKQGREKPGREIEKLDALKSKRAKEKAPARIASKERFTEVSSSTSKRLRVPSSENTGIENGDGQENEYLCRSKRLKAQDPDRIIIKLEDSLDEEALPNCNRMSLPAKASKNGAEDRGFSGQDCIPERVESSTTPEPEPRSALRALKEHYHSLTDLQRLNYLVSPYGADDSAALQEFDYQKTPEHLLTNYAGGQVHKAVGLHCGSAGPSPRTEQQIDLKFLCVAD